MFFLPPVASAVLLAVSWPDRRHPLLCLGWLLGAFVLQWFSGVYSPEWAAGVALQAILAVYLAIRIKVE